MLDYREVKIGNATHIVIEIYGYRDIHCAKKINDENLPIGESVCWSDTQYKVQSISFRDRSEFPVMSSGWRF